MKRRERAAWLPAMFLGLVVAAGLSIAARAARGAANDDAGAGKPSVGGRTAAGENAAGAGAAVREADRQRGQDLLNMAATAAGRGALLSLKDLALEESGVLTLQGADRPVRVKTIRLLPDCERTEQRVENGSVVQVICGDHGWVQTPEGTRDLTPEQIQAQKAARERDLLNVLLAPSALKVVALADTATVDGRPADVLAVPSALVQGWKIYLDHDSHRIVRMEYQDRSPATGKPALRRETFSSYVPVNGLYWPQMRTIVLDGAPLVTLRVVAATANDGVSAALFRKPAPPAK